MTQNINLIEELNIQSTTAFNSQLVVKIVIGWIVLLIISYVLGIITNANNQKTLVTLEATQKSLTEKLATYAELTEFKGKADGATKKALPVASVNIQGFYLYLEDLARLTPDGVWLNEINISELNDEITIKGKSINASGVSALLNALNKSVRLKNKKFNTLQLQIDSQTNTIDFVISTISKTKEEETKK